MTGRSIIESHNFIIIFFLLILIALFHFILNIVHKGNRFSKIFFKNSFKFISNKKSGFIIFDLDLISLLTNNDLILKKCNCKKDTFMTFDFSIFKIVLVLLTKVVIFYIQVFQV